MAVTDKINIATFADLPNMCEHVDVRFLAAATAETVTVPANADAVIFSCTGNFYLRKGGTAAVPAADVTDGTGSALNPTGRKIRGGDTFSVIAPVADTILTMEFFRVAG